MYFHYNEYHPKNSTTINTIQPNNMTSLINTTRGDSDDPFEEEVYESWRRQKKYYKKEITKLQQEVRKMHEKSNGLQ
jgi:hypothetical protein